MLLPLTLPVSEASARALSDEPLSAMLPLTLPVFESRMGSSRMRGRRS